VEEVSYQASFAAKKIIQMREKHRDLVTEALPRSAESALQVLESLYTNPIASVKGIQEVTGSAYPTANELLYTSFSVPDSHDADNKFLTSYLINNSI